MDTNINLLIYLASPYSHPDPKVRAERFEQICAIAGELIYQGHLSISPIAHGHAIASRSSLNTGWRRWQRVDTAILLRCNAMWIATLSGWERSEGIRAEVAIAKTNNIPVSLLDPKSFTVEPY